MMDKCRSRPHRATATPRSGYTVAIAPEQRRDLVLVAGRLGRLRLEPPQALHHRTQADLAGALERTQRMVGAELQGEVDVRGRRHPLLDRAVCLVDDGQVDAFHDGAQRQSGGPGSLRRRASPGSARPDGSAVRAVTVEAVARLAAETARRDHRLLHRRRPEATRLVEAFEERSGRRRG